MPKNVERPADIWMRNFASQLDLTPEALDSAFVSRHFQANSLQGDTFPQLKIFRLVNLSHASACKKSENPESSCGHIIRGE